MSDKQVTEAELKGARLGGSDAGRCGRGVNEDDSSLSVDEVSRVSED